MLRGSRTGRPTAAGAASLGLMFLWVLVACPGGDSAAPAGDPLELTLLHTNDTHAHLLEMNRFGSTCREDQRAAGECFGGVARRSSLLRRLRREREHVLLLDAGDQFQGTLFYNRFKGSEARLVMNWLGYDAMVVGNHEFDDGPEGLARFAAEVDFPVLATNVDVSREPSLAGRLSRRVVLEVGGHRLGLVGCITEQTVSLARPGPTISFLPIEETVGEAVRELEAEGVDKIVLLSHAGFERDRRIARTVAGLDVIVGGHTNTLLSNLAPDAEGPYPVVVEGSRGDPVLIVTDFAYGKYLGRLDVRFDAQGVPVHWQGDPILLDAQIEEDPAVLEFLAPLIAEIETFSNEVIGSSAVDLVGDTRVCRVEECNLGNLITDAMLAEHARQGVEVALQNGGGIRSSLARGPITVGGVVEVLPFGNTASTFGLRGSDLLATLEHGVSQAEDLANENTGRFLQVAGMRYVWSAAYPVGSRIQTVEIRQADGSWAPLEADRIYKVVSNDFNRTGGDGFDILKEQAIDPYDQGRGLAEIVQDYIRDNSPVRPEVETRIVRRDA